MKMNAVVNLCRVTPTAPTKNVFCKTLCLGHCSQCICFLAEVPVVGLTSQELANATGAPLAGT